MDLVSTRCYHGLLGAGCGESRLSGFEEEVRGVIPSIDLNKPGFWAGELALLGCAARSLNLQLQQLQQLQQNG